MHSLRRGLRGYLIRFAPHAVVYECQECSSKLPLHLVFLPILTDLTPTPAIPLTSPTLKSVSIHGSSPVEPENLTMDLYRPPPHALRPIIPGNAWGLRITAAAGTKLAAPYSIGTIICFSLKKDLYTPKGFISHAASLLHTFVH